MIPAYNAAPALAPLLDELHSIFPEIVHIVVDDGSTDSTVDIACSRKVTLLRHERNRGKGAALQTGFSYALAHGAKTILTIDADGQHNPSDAAKLLDCLQDSHVDIVLGNRMHNLSRMPTHRIISNKITSLLVSLRIGVSIEDSQTGFRAIRSHIIETINLKTRHFDTETELLIKSGLCGFKIKSVPVDTIYHGKAAVSTVLSADVWRFVRLYIKSLGWRFE